MHVLDTLQARGFVHQCTDLAALRARMDEGPVTFYCGFDPTADSLHAGSLVQLMLMAHLSRAGHRAIAVLGGGTVRVGDPSGRDTTRELLDDARIERNKAALHAQISRFCTGQLVDNAEWLLPLNYIAFLRDIGSLFSVNRMLTAEGVKQRLERDQGLSFIEFNYVLLQAFDFLELHRRHGCLLQVGGQDQWFNIINGIELIRRLDGAPAFGLTTPLLATSSGAKMGKTASGALWLDADKVNPLDYRQYWYNCDDRDVGRFLALFTFLPMERIAELQAGPYPDAKAVLADEATKIVHPGYAGGAVEDNVPVHRAALPAAVLDLLCASGLAKSRGEARRAIDNRGVRVGEEIVTSYDATVEAPGLLWLGKKRAVRVEAA